MTADALRPIDGLVPPRASGLRAEVGGDEVVSLVDEHGAVAARVHLASDGKAALVEDGESLDWLGAPAKAKTCRSVEADGVALAGKGLEARRRPGLMGERFRGA